MLMSTVTSVILCGGSGSRLWPLSREAYPKQFLNLLGKQTLFQKTIERQMGFSCKDVQVVNPVVVTNEAHRFLVLEQLEECKVNPAAIIVEPEARNTAPALTTAALFLAETQDDPILIVTPSDHLILKNDAYQSALKKAVVEAAKGKVVILGVKPEHPETAYGYCRVETDANSTSKAVINFIEKPNIDLAREFLEDSAYFWNAGIFVLRASTWLRAIGAFENDIFVTTKRAFEARTVESIGGFQLVRPEKKEFAGIPSASIDKAVMERFSTDTGSTRMVPLQAGWTDIGSWDAFWKIQPKDDNDNVKIGNVWTHESHGSLIFASDRMVSLVGVENLVVVETKDALLVSDRSNVQSIKTLVDQLKAANVEEALTHLDVPRPWGSFSTISECDEFKVKRIRVKPGASLSLQKHQYRSEHWVVVKGTAEVVCGERKFLLKQNESTYIPVGEVHSLSNPSPTLLEIIEVQTGTYFGEDDIIRLDDRYGRTVS